MPDPLSRLIADLASGPRLLPLRPAVQTYAWGGYDFIPGLLGDTNAARAPHAELWVGAHPIAPAVVPSAAGDVSLAALFEQAASALVGRDVAARFGPTLPYLLKILDVRTMLSIQVHPDARQAREGFAREESQGVPRSASNRGYRDANHKPEASVALTDFWMLYGFQPVGAIAATLGDVPELGAALRAAGVGAPSVTEGARAREWMREAYVGIMRLPQRALDEALAPLVDRLTRNEARGGIDRSTPDYWAAQAARAFAPADGLVDRGLVSIYLLNLVHLRPGEGIFIPSGLLHAYLEGVAVEVMAASDNVLRGGLTRKHVDLDELLRIVRFGCVTPQPLRALRDASGERVYATPTPEYRLGRLELRQGDRFAPGPVHGADSLLVLDGEAIVRAAGDEHPLPRGRVVLATCGLNYTVEAPRRAVLVRTSVP